MYYPTVWDWTTFIGTMGLFLTLFYLFIRVLPMIAIFEIRTLTPAASARHEGRMRTMARSSSRPLALYGVMAEFNDGDRTAARGQGGRTPRATAQMDAYTAAPIHGLAEAMGHDDRTGPEDHVHRRRARASWAASRCATGPR